MRTIIEGDNEFSPSEKVNDNLLITESGREHREADTRGVWGAAPVSARWGSIQAFHAQAREGSEEAEDEW